MVLAKNAGSFMAGTGQTSLSLEEVDVERELMAKVVKLKLLYFGHVARGSTKQLAMTVLEGSMEGTLSRQTTQKTGRGTSTFS